MSTLIRIIASTLLTAMMILGQFTTPAMAQNAPLQISPNQLNSAPPCRDQGPILIQRCADDEMLVIFNQPQLDDDGIFVECYRRVPYCVPEDLQPEG